MALILLGIDEAGYGPLLGPLCVGAAAIRVGSWVPGDPAPDLWKLLAEAVCKEPREAKSRIPVADSKRLKLANSTATKHPLVHLERGVLTFLRNTAGLGTDLPKTDLELFALLGVDLEPRPWYLGEASRVPVGTSGSALSIHANLLGGALERAGVEPLALWCRAIGETRFNTIVGETGSKAEATASVIGEYLRLAFVRWAAPGKPDSSGGAHDVAELRVVCDRQGGRTSYAPMLARECRSLPDASTRWSCAVKVLEESDRCSRYEVHDRERRMTVTFMPEAESAHLPVALASMIAKLVRELSMARFNRYWSDRARETHGVELKPTAGYRQDAARWLHDAREILSPADRRALIRNA